MNTKKGQYDLDDPNQQEPLVEDGGYCEGLLEQNSEDELISY
jgi:hypothetical protein